jgi:putative hydrolase of the HAD superfamily
MPSDLIFDFFGTLVQYTAGVFHTAPYKRTHAFLLQHAFDIDYPTFVTLYGDISADLEMKAKQTGREYHMDDVALAFFHTAFGRSVSSTTIQGFVQAFIDEWSRGIHYYDGIQGLLGELAAHYRLSILSNTHYPPLIHENLARMEVSPYFGHIMTSVEFGWRKPNRRIFNQMLADLNIDPNNALYIGDSYTDDYQGATAAGIRAMLIDPQNQYPDVSDRIASLFELRQVLFTG